MIIKDSIEELQRSLTENKEEIDKICRKKGDLQANQISPLVNQVNRLEIRIKEDQIELTQLSGKLRELEDEFDIYESQHSELVDIRRSLHSQMATMPNQDAVNHFMQSDTDQQDCWKYFKEHQMIYIRYSMVDAAPQLRLDLYTDVERLAKFIPLVLDKHCYADFTFHADQNFRLSIFPDGDRIMYSIISNVNNKSYSASYDLTEILTELKEMCGFVGIITN